MKTDRKISSQIWRDKNREKCRESSRRYYNNHIEEERARSIIKNKKYKNDNKERLKEYYIQYAKTVDGIYTIYKKNAKKRSIKFEVKKEEFIKMLGKECIYCGETSMGVDRIKNSLGYIKGNMAPCCAICNHMKKNRTVDEFINHCIKVSKHN